MGVAEMFRKTTLLIRLIWLRWGVQSGSLSREMEVVAGTFRTSGTQTGIMELAAAAGRKGNGGDILSDTLVPRLVLPTELAAVVL